MKQLFRNAPCLYMCNDNYFQRDHYKKFNYGKSLGLKEHSLLDMAVAACHRPGAENKMLFHVLA